MEEEDDEIVFHRDVLFGEYRADASLLHDIQWLTMGSSGQQQPAHAIDTTMECEPVRALPEAVEEEKEGNETELEELLRRQQAMVYTLFQYLSENFTQSLMPSLEQLLSMLMDRCKPLVEPVQRQSTLIRGIWHTFVQRMLIEMLAEDQAGTKIKEARQMLDEPYLLDARGGVVCGGRSNQANVERVRDETRATTIESLAIDKDEFFKACVGPMKRGRRRGNEKPVELNQLQVIKKHFTTKSSQMKNDRGTVVDAYPLFVKVLAVFNHCIPEEHNHGWYLAVLNRAVHSLTSREWPARGLVCSLMNAERVLPRRRLTLTTQDMAHEPLYCAYSGSPLVAGDEVWHLRVVLNSGARYKKWYKRGRVPAVPCLDSFFTTSVRAYFVRCRVVSQCSVFYSDLRVVHDAPVLPMPTPQVKENGLPLNRRFCINTLWLLLNQLRQFIATNGLGRHVFRRSHTQGPCYAAEMERVSHMMRIIEPLAFRKQFRTFLALTTFGETYVRQLLESSSEVPPQFKAYSDMLWDTVLDFTDMHFVCTGTESATAREVVSFAQFNMELFGVQLSEADQSRKKFVQLHGKLWVPHLKDTAAGLVSQLLWHSTKRITERGSAPVAFSEKQLRLWRVQRCIQQHPFLFMALFDTMFQPQEQKVPQLSRFPDALSLFNMLGLCINTVQ